MVVDFVYVVIDWRFKGQTIPKESSERSFHSNMPQCMHIYTRNLSTEFCPPIIIY